MEWLLEWDALDVSLVGWRGRGVVEVHRGAGRVRRKIWRSSQRDQ